VAVAEPHRSTARALHRHLDSLRAVAERHMAHEEADALPVASRVMTAEEHTAAERAVGRAYPLRLAAQLVPWAVHGLAPAAEQEVMAAAGPPQRLLLRLGRRRFERRHRLAFHHVAADHVER